MVIKTESAGVIPEDVKETGWDRLKSVFATNKFGESSPELDFIWKAVTSSFFCGGVTGAILAGNQAKQDFIRKNKEMMFVHPYLAKRRYLDRMLLAMAKHGFSWAWRLALFVGSCVTVTTMSAVYQNKVAVHHFTLGGAITGGMFRVNLGVRGVFAASVVGSALGTGVGVLVVSGMWVTGTTIEEMRYFHYDHWQRELRIKQDQMKTNRLKKQLEEEGNLTLLSLHNKQNLTENEQTD